MLLQFWVLGFVLIKLKLHEVFGDEMRLENQMEQTLGRCTPLYRRLPLLTTDLDYYVLMRLATKSPKDVMRQ